jgi:acyl-coenzyme A synthetase/AMP-(fatty) acid ligase
VPRTITVLDELPRGSTGKILRRELHDLTPDAGSP